MDSGWVQCVCVGRYSRWLQSQWGHILQVGAESVPYELALWWRLTTYPQGFVNLGDGGSFLLAFAQGCFPKSQGG